MPYVSSMYRLCDCCGIGCNPYDHVADADGQCTGCGYPLNYKGNQSMTDTLSDHPMVELQLYGKIETTVRGRWLGVEPGSAFFVEEMETETEG